MSDRSLVLIEEHSMGHLQLQCDCLIINDDEAKLPVCDCLIIDDDAELAVLCCTSTGPSIHVLVQHFMDSNSIRSVSCSFVDVVVRLDHIWRISTRNKI
jgi:hypothetical protein